MTSALTRKFQKILSKWPGSYEKLVPIDWTGTPDEFLEGTSWHLSKDLELPVYDAGTGDSIIWDPDNDDWVSIDQYSHDHPDVHFPLMNWKILEGKYSGVKRVGEVTVDRVLRANGHLPHDIVDIMHVLAQDLGLDSPDDIDFGYIETSLGGRLMAGANGKLTLLWNGDEGWEPMGKTYTIKEHADNVLRATVKRLLEEPEPTSLEKENDDSLDNQVDRYFGEYEGEAKNSKQEGKDFRALTRRIVSEAEGDDQASGVPGKLSGDNIDVESFANSVARMIDNYDSLLEVRSTLARRAKNFLLKSYDEEVVASFMRCMREDHGIVPGENKGDIDAEEYPAPTADRAGSGGEGPGAPPG